MMPKYKVGDKVMITTEALRGNEGVITKIMNRYYREDSMGTKFVIAVESTNSKYTLDLLQFEAINYAEDEKNRIGYYSEAAQEILSKQPVYKPGDVVRIKNDYGPIDYVIEESVLVEHTIRGGLYPIYQYKMNLLDESFCDSLHPMEAMCEEGDLTFQYHDKQWAEYFTEGNRQPPLPAWRGEYYNPYSLYQDPIDLRTEKNKKLVVEYDHDTLPVYRMAHILRDHSVYSRIQAMLVSSGTDYKKSNVDKMINDLNLQDESELKDLYGDVRRKIMTINNGVSLKMGR